MVLTAGMAPLVLHLALAGIPAMQADFKVTTATIQLAASLATMARGYVRVIRIKGFYPFPIQIAFASGAFFAVIAAARPGHERLRFRSTGRVPGREDGAAAGAD